MISRSAGGALLRLAVIAVAVLLLPSGARAGAGISLFTVFEPRAEAGVTTQTAADVAASFHSEFARLMDEHEVWGIEFLTLDAATSAAQNLTGTRSPQWSGEYTPEWIALLNTNEMITYAAVGEVSRPEQGSGALQARYELWDFILNSRIAELSASASDPATVGRDLAGQALAALQLYFAEITEVGKGRALINVGLEALTTGTLLTAYAHGHLGAHRPGYPAHGHREEDDHLLGSQVYARYRDTIPTTASLHTHSRSRWRSLLRSFPPALEDFPSTGIVVQTPTPAAPVVGQGMPQSTSPYDVMTTATEEELRLLNLAHFHSGRPTGVLKVTGFVKPHRYFNSYYAVAEVVQGIVIPGGFVRRK